MTDATPTPRHTLNCQDCHAPATTLIAVPASSALGDEVPMTDIQVYCDEHASELVWEARQDGTEWLYSARLTQVLPTPTV